MTKVDKLTAANMHRSWLNLPHVTQFDEADITDLEAFRAELKAEAERRGKLLQVEAAVIRWPPPDIAERQFTEPAV